MEQAEGKKEPILLICKRISDGPEIAGLTGRCSDCQEVVGISPATHEYIGTLGGAVTFLCMQCTAASPRGKFGDLQPMSKGQIEEVRRYFRERETGA